MADDIRLDNMRHPHHRLMELEWCKFRYAFEGGALFKNKYLKKYSTRETTEDFNVRRDITHVPAHAKAAIIEIRNAIYQRMVDITRVGGPESYKNAVRGLNHGVDGKGNTMNGFIGRVVLPELLVIGRVGVYVDKPPVSQGILTLAETQDLAPYLYHYQAEDILSWHYDETNMLDAILLRDHVFKPDNGTGLIIEEEERYRYLRRVFIPDPVTGRVKPQVMVEIHGFEHGGRAHGRQLELVQMGEPVILDLPEIPFTLMEISSSLMTDIADYQISLLNLASANINYAIKSNFPFYTEQYNPAAELPHLRPAGTAEGAAENVATDKRVDVGAAQGRRYPQGLERPGFIAPPTDPLKASMDLQDQLKTEIRQLANLSLQTVKPIRASAESKQEDQAGLIGGLAAIGLELEFGERNIARIWSQYEGQNLEPTINYPETYESRSDDDRRSEAEELAEIRPIVNSQTFQKIITRKIAKVMVGPEASNDELQQIMQELDQQEVFSTDPEVIRQDHEAGFVSTQTASEARGYPKGEVTKAKIDHAERLARIAAAQTSEPKMASRGVPDMDPDQENSASNEKEDSRNTDQQETTTNRTRGEGR